MLMIQRWKQCAMNGPIAKYNKIFFSNNCQWVTFAKFCFLVQNTARYLKQYLFCVSTQHILVFLSITLNWSIEGYLTLYYLIYGKMFENKIYWTYICVLISQQNLSQIFLMLRRIQRHTIIIFSLWCCGPTRVMVSSSLRFLHHTQRLITVGRTPMDEWSAGRRDVHLTTHNTQKRKTSTTPKEFEPHSEEASGRRPTG